MKIGPLQDAWLRTLEAGTHKQGNHNLCEVMPDGDHASCCLGVACEVLIANGVDVAVKRAGVRYHYDSGACYFNNYKFMCLRGYLGDIDRSLVKAKWRESLIGHQTLSCINDNAGWDFKDIAKFIRENPEAVFTGPV